MTLTSILMLSASCLSSNATAEGTAKHRSAHATDIDSSVFSIVKNAAEKAYDLCQQGGIWWT